MKDITCDKSVIVLSGDDILLGDCENVTHLENEENAQNKNNLNKNNLIWRDDKVHTLLANCLTIEMDPEDQTNTSFIG